MIRLSTFRGAFLPVGLLIVWEIASRAGLFSAVVLPPPSAVAARWFASLVPALPHDPATQSYTAWLFSGELPHDAVASLSRVIAGFAIGVGLALPIGLLMGTSDRLYGLVNPLLQILRPIPPIAYIPLAIVWFGLGNPPALFLIALGTFFPVLVNTIAGVRHVDGIYIRAARSLGASRMTIFRRVILPAATPYILSGARIGIGTAFIVVIVAEMIAVKSGFGYVMWDAYYFLRMDVIVAAMLSVGVMGFVFDRIAVAVQGRVCAWND